MHDLRQPQKGVGGADPELAAQSDLQPASEAAAVNGGGSQNGQAFDGAEQCSCSLQLPGDVIVGSVPEQGHISPVRKVPALAGDDKSLDSGVVPQKIQQHGLLNKFRLCQQVLWPVVQGQNRKRSICLQGG